MYQAISIQIQQNNTPLQVTKHERTRRHLRAIYTVLKSTSCKECDDFLTDSTVSPLNLKSTMMQNRAVSQQARHETSEQQFNFKEEEPRTHCTN